MSSALMSFGAKNSREAAREKKKIKEYDVIMEEEIQFVQALQMPGTMEGIDKVGWVVVSV